MDAREHGLFDMGGATMNASTRTVSIIASVLAAGMFAAQWFGDSGDSSVPAKSPQPSAVQCKVSDFRVSPMRISWGTNAGAVTLTASVYNGCSQSAAPELKWTAYYPDGSIAFSEEFWPAGAVNMAPHSRYPFEYLELARPQDWKYTLRVVAVTQWGRP